MPFKIGDTVQLKSGGPIMTVSKTGNDTRGTPSVWCTWFDKTEAKHGMFPADAVRAATGLGIA